MPYDFASTTPIFEQVARNLEDDIAAGRYLEGEQIPSTTEISASEHINPATVLKGMNILVAEGWIEKRRGLGMFVTSGAREGIREKRRQSFYSDYIAPLLEEAGKLGLGKDDVIEMIMEDKQ